RPLLCCPLSMSCTPTASTRPCPLSLHDALPITRHGGVFDPLGHKLLIVFRDDDFLTMQNLPGVCDPSSGFFDFIVPDLFEVKRADRKSTRLNSSHVSNSYAVLCLNKKIRNPSHR